MKKLLLASDFDRIFSKPSVQAILSGYKNLLFIPTASYHKDYQTYFENNVRKVFETIGIASELLEISDKSHAQVRSALEKCDIVYIGGGNTFFLLEKLKQCNFKEALDDFLKKGGLYIGSSAGAIAACPDIGFIAPMDDPSIAKLSDNKGLGLVDFSVLPHLENKEYEEYAAAALEIANNLIKQKGLSFGLRDDQALWIRNEYVEIL
ncbi:MAG: Type 1 glutamine amidotransferase-like domain-containing protein [Dongiaceae bacterium]